MNEKERDDTNLCVCVCVWIKRFIHKLKRQYPKQFGLFKVSPPLSFSLLYVSMGLAQMHVILTRQIILAGIPDPVKCRNPAVYPPPRRLLSRYELHGRNANARTHIDYQETHFHRTTAASISRVPLSFVSLPVSRASSPFIFHFLRLLFCFYSRLYRREECV